MIYAKCKFLIGKMNCQAFWQNILSLRFDLILNHHNVPKKISIFVQMNMMYELILAKKKVEEAALMEEQMASMSAASFKKVNKYEYDSDEDIEGGTWEHKNRTAEMEATRGKEQVFSLEMMQL